MKRSRWSRIAMGLVVVLAAVAGASALLGSHISWPSQEAKASTPSVTDAVARRVPVLAVPVKPRAFEERVKGQGNIEAKNYATVSARIPGTVEALFVDEGDPVVAGETKLFEIDALKVKKALEVSRQDLAVAKCARREKEANLDRVTADLEKAEIDYLRFQRLYENKTVSEDALEQQESRFKQTKALHTHAVSLVDLGVEQERQAVAAVAIAEKTLSDATVYAPISGTVAMRCREVGEMADVGKPVFRIEDPAVLEVSVYLPAQFYARVVPGKTPVRVDVYGIDVPPLTVSYKSPTIHPKLRTFEVKCMIQDPPPGVVPGAMAEAEVLLDQFQGLGVPAAAVLTRNDGSVVFTLQDGAARQVDVQTGLENDGWIEVRSPALSEGVPVVTMGQNLLDDGTPVNLQEAGA
ncbi:MAG: efflux RND transporter periplasmic adaptor subunit [bacterium]|nr:efflux RND transporter periplasmic adaptor subunit [bacterium]